MDDLPGRDRAAPPYDKFKLPSRHTTVGPERAPHRPFLYAMGLSARDIAQPFVGVVSTWNEAAPCNIALRRQAQAIADSVELTMRGHCYDALVGVAGCDKTLPGLMMAMLRLNVPSVFLYGGSILPGRFRGRDVTVLDVFEAVGAHGAGTISDANLAELEAVACPSAGSCGGQYTANSMAYVSEAIGLALPGSASTPAPYESRDRFAELAGKTVMDLLARGLRPRDIVTRKALENAAAVVAATGGSTNAALHLPAMAHEAGIAFDIFDVAAVFKRTPLIADLKPGGRYLAKDVHEIGGVPVVLKALLDGGFLHGECLTVTGRSLAENLDGVRLPQGQDVVRPTTNPLSPTGGLVGLSGNLAPEGAIVKVAGLHTGVVVLFVQIGAPCSKNPLPDKHLRIRDFRELRPFRADWCAFGSGGLTMSALRTPPRSAWRVGHRRHAGTSRSSRSTSAAGCPALWSARHRSPRRGSRVCA